VSVVLFILFYIYCYPRYWKLGRYFWTSSSAKSAERSI